MILADTSIWVYHLRKGSDKLRKLLNDGNVVCHPFIIGELACGNIKNRKEILSLLKALPATEVMDNEELLLFIEKNNLMNKGLGFVDIHLLGTALLSKVLLWTSDSKLQQQARALGISYIN